MASVCAFCRTDGRLQGSCCSSVDLRAVQTGAGVADKVKIAAFNAMCAKSLVLLVAVLIDVGFGGASSCEGKLRIFRRVLIKRCQLVLAFLQRLSLIALADARGRLIRQTFEQIGKGFV